MPDHPPSRSSAPKELLRTKLAPPRLPAGLVPRQRLIEQLEAGLARKLTLVAAPAGFGKSTLVAGWIQPHSFGWLSLEPGDNDPVRFWSYLLTVCRGFQPALGKAALAALRAAQPPALESVLTPFINELARLPGRRVLVLEDYQALTDLAIHQSLAFLVDHLPPSLHLVLISRELPPLPLARWRARDELSELTAADLRFSDAETRAFLEQALGRLPPPAVLAEWEQRAEGWVAGLRLLALAVQAQPGPRPAESFLAALGGGRRHVQDYLISEVFAAQPEPVQQFLLLTSALSRLNASLCNAITGRADSAQMLEQLERSNLFVVPLEAGDGQAWYRYHLLFAEAMQRLARQRLGEDGLRDTQAAASRWYEAHGLAEPAIEAALAARQVERAGDLMAGYEFHNPAETVTLRAWVERLPPAVLYTHPELCFRYAFATLFTSDRRSPATAARLEAPLRAAEEAWRRAGNQASLGQALALRTLVAWWQDDRPRAFALAAQSLELLADDDVFWRGIALSYVGMSQLLAGRLMEAQRLLLEARALCEASQNVYAAQATTLLLSQVAAGLGDLDQALQYAELARSVAQASGHDDMLDDQGQAALELAGVAYERDDLLAAERHAARAAEVGRLTGDELLESSAELVLARVEQARGQAALARQRLQALAARLGHPSPLREVQAAQARLRLAPPPGDHSGSEPAAAEDLAAAERWAAGLDAQAVAGFVAQPEREALIVARLRLRQGQPAAALKLLETWRAEAHAQGRARSELEMLVLEALAAGAHAGGAHPGGDVSGVQHTGGDLARAQAALTRALSLAQPQGYRRLFLDEGQPMAELLRAALPGLARSRLAAYAASLLRACSAPRQPAVASPHGEAGGRRSPLFEPLSPQEQRVLRLLVAGLSNAAIARELVVSTNTVKTQLKSIYRKLDVANRDEAADAARELDLL